MSNELRPQQGSAVHSKMGEHGSDLLTRHGKFVQDLIDLG
jgi:hypothetical protein